MGKNIHCQLTVSRSVATQDEKLYNAITSLGFRVCYLAPLVIEKGSTTQQDIVKLMEMLESRCDVEESADSESDLEDAAGAFCSRPDDFAVADTGYSKLRKQVESPSSSTDKSLRTNSDDLEDMFEKPRPKPRTNKSSEFGKITAQETAPLDIQTTKINKESQSEFSNFTNETKPKISLPYKFADTKGGLSPLNDDSDSSESDDELIYEMDTMQFKLAKYYLQHVKYQPFFDKAEERNAKFVFNIKKNTPESLQFLNALHQLKFTEVGFDIKDQAHAELIAGRVIGRTKAMISEDKILLVGPQDEIKAAKAEVISLLRNQEDTSSEASESMTPRGPKSRYYGMVEENSERHGSTPLTRSSIGASKEIGHAVYRGVHSGLRVQVYQGDITTLGVDCIVSPSSSRLNLGVGVARAVALAAGRELLDACYKYIGDGNIVDVTNVFLAPGGDLPAKFVLFAVGPMWDIYLDKGQCIDDLRRTILRCLFEAARLGMASVAFTSISAAICKVPQELCAHSYMQAVKQFDVSNAEEAKSSLRDVHFVDLDETMVICIQDYFSTHWDECLGSKDSVFGHQQPRTNQEPLRRSLIDPAQERQLSSSRVVTKQEGPDSSRIYGATASAASKFTMDEKYHIQDIQLQVTNRPISDFHADLIITIGDVLDKLRPQSNLTPCDEMPSKKDVYTFFTVSIPDGTFPHLLCTVSPDPQNLNDLKSAFGNIETAVSISSSHGSEVRDMKSVLLTSNILYAEASSKVREDKKHLDRAMVKNFTLFLIDFLEKSSVSSNPLKNVVVTAGDDAVPIFCRVMESSDVARREQ